MQVGSVGISSGSQVPEVTGPNEALYRKRLLSVILDDEQQVCLDGNNTATQNVTAFYREKAISVPPPTQPLPFPV